MVAIGISSSTRSRRGQFLPGAKVKRIQDALADPFPTLTELGELLVGHSKKAFREQSWDGEPWAPRSVPNVFGILRDMAKGETPPPHRFEARPALIDTGHMMDSITYTVEGVTVDVGSAADYATQHQEGDVVESEKITDEIAGRLAQWLREEDQEIRNQLGWLLNKKFRGKKLEMELPERRFTGITEVILEDIDETIGVRIFEVIQRRRVF